jgi:hypothetical protein
MENSTEETAGNGFASPRVYVENYDRDLVAQSLKKGADEGGMDQEDPVKTATSKLISSVVQAIQGTSLITGATPKRARSISTSPITSKRQLRSSTLATPVRAKPVKPPMFRMVGEGATKDIPESEEEKLVDSREIAGDEVTSFDVPDDLSPSMREFCKSLITGLMKFVHNSTGLVSLADMDYTGPNKISVGINYVNAVHKLQTDFLENNVISPPSTSKETHPMGEPPKKKVNKEPEINCDEPVVEIMSLLSGQSISDDPSPMILTIPSKLGLEPYKMTISSSFQMENKDVTKPKDVLRRYLAKAGKLSRFSSKFDVNNPDRL